MVAAMYTASLITAPAIGFLALLACCNSDIYKVKAANTSAKDAFIDELVSQMTVPEMGESAFVRHRISLTTNKSCNYI